MKENKGVVFWGFFAFLLVFPILSPHVVPSESFAAVTDDAYYEGGPDSAYGQPEEGMGMAEEMYGTEERYMEEHYDDERQQMLQDYQEPPSDVDEEPFPEESPGEESAPGLYEGEELTPAGTVRWR